MTLLRSCLSLPKVSHILRCCPPSYLIQAAEGLDSAMRETFEVITGAPVTDWSWLKASLPSSLGGLNVQKFALRICSRSYDTNYQDLLDCYHLPSLENRRIYLSLCTFYKIVNSIIFFPSHYLPVASPLNSLPLSLRCNHSNHFKIPYARTNSFKFSFLPSMLLWWNNLSDVTATCESLSMFKYSITPLLLV